MSEKLTISIQKRTPESEIRENKEQINDEYDSAVDKMIEGIPEHLSDKEKLAMLYGVFLKNMTYDFATGGNVRYDGLVDNVDDPRYYKIIKGKDLRVTGKDAAVLRGFGVCQGFSEAFADIATNKLGVPCALVTGKTREITLDDSSKVEIGHAWNQVLIDGEIKNIDVTYGLFANDDAIKQEKGIAPEITAVNFFLVDSDELRRVGPHHDFEHSPEL